MNTQNFRGLRANSEQADAYPCIVFQHGNGLRVIVCRDGIQWIVQQRSEKALSGTRWRPVSYHRSKKSLIRRLPVSMAELDPFNQAVLDALPDWIEDGGGNVSCR